MRKLLLILSFFCLVFASNIACAEQAISTIRDDETEKLLKEIIDPIMRAIGLDPESIEIVIVNDPSINAFVSGGQRIFINTGLIAESDDVSTLIGVLAHESGHIKGAHIIQKGNDYEKANYGAIAGYVLGLGSVLAGAPPEAGLAISSAGQNIAMRNLLSYSRDYENAADTVALEVCKKIGVTPRGLVNLLRKLLSEQKISGDIVDKYMLTHPVSQERIKYIESYLDKNPGMDKPASADLQRRFLMVKAKIYGFLYDFKKTQQIYGGKDADEAYYALSILKHRKAKFAESDTYLNKLMAKYPDNYYLKELRAQFLFERGNVDGSISEYRKVLTKLDKSALIRLKLANALLNKKDSASYEEAASQLKAALLTEPRNISLVNQLGLAYGKLGKLGTSYLYFAESAIIANNLNNAKFYLRKAEANVEKGSVDFVKLTELKNELDRLLDK